MAHIELLNNTFENMKQITKFSEGLKSIFALTNRCYRLLLTILVTVAKDDSTFSRLKIVKTPHQTTIGDKRLESLLLLSCETNIIDSIDISVIAKLELGIRRTLLLTYRLSGLLVSYHEPSFQKIINGHPVH